MPFRTRSDGRVFKLQADSHNYEIPAETREFIGDKISELKHEDYPQQQSIAIAYSELRQGMAKHLYNKTWTETTEREKKIINNMIESYSKSEHGKK